jgi:arylsulfatase
VKAARDAVLFTYSGLITNDSALFKVIADAKGSGQNPALAVVKAGYKPDMKKRGSVRTVFDGRFKFSRYFSPLNHNSPTTIDELYNWNDVELFDLQSDPDEVINLAANLSANRALITAMSAKLEAIIKAEIGKDDGRELPSIPFVHWNVDRVS